MNYCITGLPIFRTETVMFADQTHCMLPLSALMMTSTKQTTYHMTPNLQNSVWPLQACYLWARPPTKQTVQHRTPNHIWFLQHGPEFHRSTSWLTVSCDRDGGSTLPLYSACKPDGTESSRPERRLAHLFHTSKCYQWLQCACKMNINRYSSPLV